MSDTRKDKPWKFRKESDRTNYKAHGGLKCPCCGIDDDSFKKTDRQQGKQEIKRQLED